MANYALLPGKPLVVPTADPGAGAEILYTLTKESLLVGVSVVNVQAAAGSAQPILVIDDGDAADIICESLGSTNAQGISTTCRFNWWAGGPPPANVITGGGAGANKAYSVLPSGLILPVGARVQTSTIGLSANNNYGPALLYLFER